MKESFWGVFLVTLGIIGISVLNVLQTVVSTNENNYYLLREVTEASMFDAVDLGHYRRTGELKIIEEKFVENFTRRFSMTYGRNNDYAVGIYDIIEMPPKVSLVVEVDNELRIYNYDSVDFNINNRVDAILEMKFPAYNEVVSSPAIPGVFLNPTSSTIFKNNTTIPVSWVATSSWGSPSSNNNYRLEFKCENGSWTFVKDTTSVAVNHNVVCAGKTIQYRVRAESDGGISVWRYSDVVKAYVPPVINPTAFSYTGNVQQYVVPVSGEYKLEVWGAQGGNGSGGRGGYSSGTKYLNEGQILYVYVGGTNGWNGGGSGHGRSSNVGGGATDMRLGGTALGNRIIVAGGGGGRGPGSGGYGGGSTGGTSTGDYGEPCTGATQSSGGSGAKSCGGSGSLGQGGSNTGCGSKSGGGGGGGGYYGGGAGGSDNYNGYNDYDDYGGCGGSGYIGGVTGGTMIAGNKSMPNPSGGNMTGRTGSGYAKITFVKQ